MKILILLTTYKREEKLVNLVKSFDSPAFEAVAEFLEILVCDDDPRSLLASKLESVKEKHCLKVHYIQNTMNLGQGPNAINGLSIYREYDYYWMPGDDDLIDPEQTTKLFKKIHEYRPAVGVLEFRQGKDLKLGTFFTGESRIVADLDEAIEFITRYGKGVSAIFSRPSDWSIELVKSEFGDCMYQDKVLSVLSLLESKKRFIYLQTEVTATGDGDFGKLRYSQRVFLNLDAAINYAKQLYNLKHGATLSFRKCSVSRWDSLNMWLVGLRSHFDHRSEVSYTTQRLFKELFVFPLKFICKSLGLYSNRFEK